jgi:hypothetical protein
MKMVRWLGEGQEELAPSMVRLQLILFSKIIGAFYFRTFGGFLSFFFNIPAAISCTDNRQKFTAFFYVSLLLGFGHSIVWYALGKESYELFLKI